MICYLAGPISGDPIYRMKFAAVSYAIKKRRPDASVINPAMLPEGMAYSDYMAICLPMLMRADIVFMLPNWQSSGGALIEKHLADYLNIRVVEISKEVLAAALEDMKR